MSLSVVLCYPKKGRVSVLSNDSSASGLLWWQSGKESACSEGDMGLIPGSGRSLKEEMATHSSILVLEIPWTEEPGGL